MQAPERYRLRLTFAKKRQLKYIAHLDLVRAWERALRRAQIPLAYSQGFNPQPKIQVASGLPVGTAGRAELMDILVTEPLDLAEALRRIRAGLPEGLALHAIEEIPRKAPAMQQLLRQAEYTVWVETELSAPELSKRIAAVLAAEQIIQTRIRKRREEQFDLRPWLHELRLAEVSGGVARLHMRLTAGQSGNLRPQAVLKALGLADNWAEYERGRLIFAEE